MTLVAPCFAVTVVRATDPPELVCSATVAAQPVDAAQVNASGRVRSFAIA